MSKVEQLQEALEKSESQLAECHQKLAQHVRDLQRKEGMLTEVRKLKKEEDGWRREMAVLSEQLERLRSEKVEENEQLQEAGKKVTELTEEMQALKQETITMRGQLEAYKVQVLLTTTSNKNFILKYFRCWDGKRTETRIGMEYYPFLHSTVHCVHATH